jgi:hypothetical protein
MDQRLIALYLTKKGLSATAIHRDLEETLGLEAVTYSAVTMFLRTLSFRGETEEEEIGDHDKPLDEVDQAILKALADEPFSSVRELAHVPIQNYGASVSHVFPWLYGWPSLLGAPSAVTRSEGKKGRTLERIAFDA